MVGSVAAPRVLLNGEIRGPARVEWNDDGVISAIDAISALDAIDAIDAAPNVTLAPGFVDLQVNGIGAIDVARANGEHWEQLDRDLIAHGVTSWCPTLITAPLASYGAPLERIADAAMRPGPRPSIVGAHLEGPFLGGAPGAHRRDRIVELDLAWLHALPQIVRLITLAPEQRMAPDAIRLLTQRGITVALGHSTATHDQTCTAAHAGATLVTHLFNGMAPLHHRSPGVASTALLDDRLSVSLIADGVHVHPDFLQLALRVKGADRVVLVTDAVAWQAGTAGEVRLALGADGAPRLADGTLAGSALTMDAAIRCVVNQAHWPLGTALRAASTNPAALIGLCDRGEIAVGKRADLVLLDDTLHVQQTWIAGAPAASLHSV